MSCAQCDLYKGEFKTEDEFLKFEDLVARLVESGQLIELGRKSNARFYEVEYQCRGCKAIWTLSFPDQAFRGGWHEG